MNSILLFRLDKSATLEIKPIMIITTNIQIGICGGEYEMKIYDISQEVFGCQVYPGDPTPKKRVISSMEKGDLYNLTAFSMCAHNGTHIDAPFHFIKYGKTVDCNGVQREHNKKLNNGLPILHKVPPKRDYGRYFCIMAEKGGTSHGGLTEKLSPFFHAKKQEVNAYGR